MSLNRKKLRGECVSLTDPSFSVEAEMNIREVNVNSRKTQLLKEGKVVDQNSTTTKEVTSPL